jgi:4-diphosphocytidyl-2-C-methyl-D-erythritol kinase
VTGGAARGDSIAGAGMRDVARAKVNLTLQIRGRRPDGYHELESLTAFTRFGDFVKYRAGAPFSLDADGPFAPAIEGGNLIARAAALYADAAGTPESRGAFLLEKHIPVAAGLGGGSADAAAALRLLAGMPSDPRGLSALLPLAAKLGADVPVCVFSKPAIMTGIGETLRFLTAFPAIPILLVNPRQPLATAAVFRELRAGPLAAAAENPAPIRLAGINAVVSYAAARSNDLEAPARRLLPVIGVILDALAACPGALLARLSGSGPTCFALFRTESEAEAAAVALAEPHPQWWVQATTLSG